MFAYIKGKLAYKEASMAIIETNGVGYQLNIPLSTYTELGDQEECLLHTHMSVREDAHTLFGFKTIDEKKMFLDLIGISGVGPSTALASLSTLSVIDLKSGIASENVKQVQSIKGIGAKSAQRIVLELKDKYQKEGVYGSETENNSTRQHNTIKQEALTALTTLGVIKSSAEKTIDKILKTHTGDLTLENLIRIALKSS